MNYHNGDEWSYTWNQYQSSKKNISLEQVQGGKEELGEIQEKDQVKKIEKNLHNFLIGYQNHKLLSSLERLLQGLCDHTVTRG